MAGPLGFPLMMAISRIREWHPQSVLSSCWPSTLCSRHGVWQGLLVAPLLAPSITTCDIGLVCVCVGRHFDFCC